MATPQLGKDEVQILVFSFLRLKFKPEFFILSNISDIMQSLLWIIRSTFEPRSGGSNIAKIMPFCVRRLHVA